jgi:hypothetical protein
METNYYQEYEQACILLGWGHDLERLSSFKDKFDDYILIVACEDYTERRDRVPDWIRLPESFDNRYNEMSSEFIL